ncbi:hypothetical protein JTE90_022955 [Oedothorax gibbosus]|uniref:non-specific serine/threonine protein kinase n=1 Tax=Oedothorax gibbosus TaxID=931172 RepID=A0AAV6VBK5_9ARAC|nr:hypothetical protein JTE90_022955 [Oedothorax gibbosus]
MLVFCYKLRALLIYLSIFISCYNCLENIHLTEDDSEIKSACNEREYIFIATIDGNLTALDFKSGRKCWSITLDAKGFLLSSVDKVEVWENNTRVWMIPSLDGVLFKFDRVKLQPLPLNAESFLTQSAMFDQHSFTTAEKFKLVYGVCRHTGEIYYKCSTENCETFGRGSVEDTLIVEQVIQSAAASDSLTAENRWHFRVVELKIKTIPTLNTIKNGSFEQNACGEHALMIYDNLFTSYDVPTMKISLANGYAGRINQSYEFTWIHKSSVPIVDVWHNSNNRVQLLDPFADDSNFFSIYSDDGKQAALLFLGSYRNQLFVKQSKVLKTKVVQNHALSKQGYFEAHFQEPKIPPSLPDNKSNALALADININDHGYYFYVNFSVYENETHCIVDFKYPKFSGNFSQANYWLKLTASILFAVIPLGVFWSVRRSRRKKKFANEGTSTLELTLNTPEKIPDSSISNLDFVSRFHKDFQLVTILGKGGFGVVMEVKNKIDDCDYAVKRIQIRLKDEYKQLGSGPVMREVKALAKLDHPGVVRYFNSWVEYPPKGWQQLKDKELDIVDVSHSETCEELVKSAEENHSKFKNDLRQENVFAKLAENPLKPINEDFFNDTDFDYNPSSHWSNEDSTSDSNNSSNSQSEDSSLSDDSSDTLSLNDASKISEWSLYFDHGDESKVNIFLQEKKDVPNHSSKKFFELYGNLLHQPKTAILLEEQKDKLFMMFCNAYLPEKVKPPSSFLMTTDESKNEVLGFLYIQMQLCRRDSLRNWLDIHSQNRNYCEVMNIFHQIVEAMAYVHAQGLMHRDLKPSNIYFSLEGLIKIGDFGLATQFEMQGLPEELMPDEHTSHCGTALYMSPEQRSKKCYNYKTDIFSLGIILYELLVPFATRAERYKAIYAARDRQFSQDFISKYYKESMLVQKLLDIDPKRRPTASEIKKHPLFQKFQNSRT